MALNNVWSDNAQAIIDNGDMIPVYKDNSSSDAVNVFAVRYEDGQFPGKDEPVDRTKLSYAVFEQEMLPAYSVVEDNGDETAVYNLKRIYQAAVIVDNNGQLALTQCVDGRTGQAVQEQHGWQRPEISDGQVLVLSNNNTLFGCDL